MHILVIALILLIPQFGDTAVRVPDPHHYQTETNLPISPSPLFGNTGGAGQLAGDHQIAATQGITIPYEFEVLDLDDPDREPLPISGFDFTTVDFINYVGSIAISVVAVFNSYGIIGQLTIICIAFVVTYFLMRLIFGQRVRPETEEQDVVGEDEQSVNEDDYEQIVTSSTPRGYIRGNPFK